MTTTLSRSSTGCDAARRSGRFQQTIATAAHCRGIALHSGVHVDATFLPAEVGTGIVFRRTDVEGDAAAVAARWDAVSDTRFCTTLRNGYGTTVATVEHVMAALAACEIDNLVIELSGPEPPAMDGSAAPFVGLIREAGVVEQKSPRNALRVRRPVAVGDRGRFACLLPADDFSVECEIEFASEAVGRQRYRYSAGVDLADDVAPARTFGFMHEVDALRRNGLALGGSLDNAVVVDGDRILNDSGLRWADEFARHKVLDAVGDLYLVGAPIIGRFRGYHSGHELNNSLLRALFQDPAAWSWKYQCTTTASGELERSRLV